VHRSRSRTRPPRSPISNAKPEHVNDRALAIHLNDHLAGATGGLELARRTAGANSESAEFGPPLASICAEIETDRETLRRLMRELGAGEDRVKRSAGWLAEKAGRLKLNGQLRGYSPLSRLVELEGLAIGIASKASLWRTLEQELGAQWRGFDFAQLCERAERQQETVEQLRLKAAALALSG
jgi:hypothetical protein